MVSNESNCQTPFLAHFHSTPGEQRFWAVHFLLSTNQSARSMVLVES